MSLRFQRLLSLARAVTTPIAALYENGVNADLTTDLTGALFTRDSGAAPLGPPTNKWTYRAVPGVATAVIRAIANEVLTQVGGYNDSAGNIYVQLHNTNVAIVAAAAPVFSFFVPPSASFAWTPTLNGEEFSTGIAFGVSSTRDTYTAFGTNIFLFADGYTP